MVVHQCSVHSTQSVNTEGTLAANKSAYASMKRTSARVRAPTPGRRQSPFQRCLLCRTRAWAIGCAPQRQPRTATCDLSADAPHQATIAGPSITHSYKAWRTGGDEFGPAICGEPKMADFAAGVWNFSEKEKRRYRLLFHGYRTTRISLYSI
jgi:hypothetical protein